MKWCTGFLGLLFFCTLYGQKQLRKILADIKTQAILIDAKNCYQVTLGTVKTNEIRVEASIEGEYSKNLSVNLEEQGKTILLSTGFHPNFISPNDKLSTHKVVSIALRIEVPEHKTVKIFGTGSNVCAEGNYKNLGITLAGGECRITNVGETVNIRTQKGDIWLNARSGNVDAKSSYGQVFKSTIPNGDNHYVLTTKEGNIYLNKTK